MSSLIRKIVLGSGLSSLLLAPWAIDSVLAAGKSVQDIRPEACKQCHEEIFQQWTGSMHANSTALKDPIHAAFYRVVMGDPTEEGLRGPQVPVKKDKYPVCLNCHAPAAALEGKTKLDAKSSYGEGVSCMTCHSFTHYKGIDGPGGKPQYGVVAYETDTKSLHGASGISYTTKRVPQDAQWPTPVHHPQPMSGNKSDLFKSNAICMGCHDKRHNFNKVPLCQTGAEYQTGKTFINCQACHMPIVTVPKLDKGKIVEGEYVSIADHTMAGGHDDKMVTRGVALDMDVRPDGEVIRTRLTLRNRLPHSYPTGAPFRNAYLKLAAYDKDGKELWKNYGKHPMKDDPQAMFVLTIGDETGPTSPPFATMVLGDTRLMPNEIREIEYEIPANKHIAIIRAELLYNLLLPGLIEKFGDKLPDDVKRPKLAASSEFRL